ncbi:MAG TPA: class I SAM-dependent methyltransferase, partial [Candidatus Norongarragalinales archaeon]|nr:class I SAM-dependent methyltransferase [Candidatus Norongarragalinales archaeon]
GAGFIRPHKNPILRFLTAPFIPVIDWFRVYPDGYTDWNTPIKKYGEPVVDAESLLKKEEGRQIKVLDVGIGRGSRWLRILKKNRNIEFHGTSLNKNYDPLLKNVKQIHAGELTDHYDANTFDYVFTHYGIHRQAFRGIENIVHVLKPGGQAVITISLSRRIWKRKPSKLESFEAPDFYEIVGANQDKNSIVLHIRKK